MGPAVAWEAWRTSRQGYGHSVPGAWLWGQGSGEALIALEAGARSGWEITPEAQGSGVAEPASEAKRLGRDGACARGQGVGRDEAGVRGQGVGRDGAGVRGQEARARRSLRLRPGGSDETGSVPKA
jgi:hypothetical protein